MKIPNVTATQQRVMTLVKALGTIDEWDLKLRHIPLSSAEALVKKGFLERVNKGRNVSWVEVK